MRTARVLGGLVLLALLVWQVGTGAFLQGVRAVNGSAIVVAFAIGVLSTVCCAWRWTVVAGALGMRLPLRDAVGAYYRSQFLNTTLPGGVVGDVHRAFRHGLDVGNVRLGVRAVVLERVAGQVVQVAIAVAVLSAFPSPVRSHWTVVVAVAVAVGAGLAVVAARAGLHRTRQALYRSHRAWLAVGLASAVAVLGHLATFVLAARTAGATAPLTRLVPLTFLALLAMGLPLSIAGWGPREGVAAWAFGAAGLTAGQGVTTAVTYGVLVFVASLPGAAALVMSRRGVRWVGRQLDTVRPPEPVPVPAPVLDRGGAHG